MHAVQELLRYAKVNLNLIIIMHAAKPGHLFLVYLT